MATFEDYLNNLGATKTQIGYSSAGAGGFNPIKESRGELGGDATAYYGPAATIGYSKGFQKYGLDQLPNAPYNFGQQTASGFGNKPGFVDASGGFIGYGSSYDDLRGLDIGYSEDVDIDPERQRLELANNLERQRQLEATRQAHQDYMNSLPSVGAPAGSSQLTGSPQGFSGFGGPMPGFGAPQQQAQAGVGARPGLLGGLHRGKFGGTGLLGGSGQ